MCDQCNKIKVRPEFESIINGEYEGELLPEMEFETQYESPPAGPRNSREYIKWVQSSLNKILGLKLDVDGIRGTMTKSAIRSFQTKNRLSVDGTVGPITEAAILSALPGPSTPAISPHTAALNIIKQISTFHNIPWIIPFIIMEHEGGLSLVNHPDGVMQTIASARRSVIPAIPSLLKKALLGLAPGEPISDAKLNEVFFSRFAGNPAVQIAAGTQEIVGALNNFNGYLALAFQQYNAGIRNAYSTIGYTAGTSKVDWEQRCHRGAALLHSLPSQLRIAQGTYQCDRNMPGWFAHVPVFHAATGKQLIAYKYLRSITYQINSTPPSKTTCDTSTHGSAHRQPGSGSLITKVSRPGILDKLYNPSNLGTPYYNAIKGEFSGFPTNAIPLKAINGAIITVP